MHYFIGQISSIAWAALVIGGVTIVLSGFVFYLIYLCQTETSQQLQRVKDKIPESFGTCKRHSCGSGQESLSSCRQAIDTMHDETVAAMQNVAEHARHLYSQQIGSP